MKKNRLIALSLVVVLATTMLLAGCSDDKASTENNTAASGDSATKDDTNSNKPNDEGIEKIPDAFTNFDQDDTWGDDAKKIELSSGDVKIEKEGTYVLSGTLSDGQIYVDVDDEEKVQLVLNGVDITCTTSAAIFVENADKVSLTLAPGTVNTVTDGGNADTTDADGCIYSKDDLSINGSGKLIVNGKVSNGIDCNNDIKIVGGELVINAKNNGIKAKESISVKNCDITVKADDCIKVSDKNDETVGTFYMESGTMDLDATDDGITATVSITIIDGDISMAVIGKKTNCDGEEKIASGCIVER